jgi:nucleoside-diphosphate-sugar epimerase
MTYVGYLPFVLVPIFPAIFVSLSWFLGVYTRYKTARGRQKAGLLLAAACASAVAGVMFGGVPCSILWFVTAFPLAAIPRLFLSMAGRNPSPIIEQTFRSRGPVLVVGGAGYIGTHVVEQLLASNHKVRVLDRLIHGKEPIREFEHDGRVEIIRGDATDISKLVFAMPDVSAVVHLGGLVGDPACAVDPRLTRHANVVATRMLHDAAFSMGVPRFIFASSCSVYGCSEEEVDENSPLNPVSLYARTKIDSETELLTKQHDSMALTILRFATVFGHSRRPRFDLVANLFAAQATINGKITVIGEDQWRPFIHVRDLARAIVSVLKAKPELVANQIFNVGDKDLNSTIGQLSRLVKEIVDPFRPVTVERLSDVSDRRNYRVDFSKIERVLNFRAATTLDSGIREIVQNFRAGLYGNFRDPKYSNLEMTKETLKLFENPSEAARLYQPVFDSAQSLADA